MRRNLPHLVSRRRHHRRPQQRRRPAIRWRRSSAVWSPISASSPRNGEILSAVPPHAQDVLIIGGGAAGLATAIFLRRQSSRPVTVIDGARTLGAKILVSGGGRCNVTNAVVTERDFWGGRRTVVRQVLRAFPAGAAIAFFRE